MEIMSSVLRLMLCFFSQPKSSDTAPAQVGKEQPKRPTFTKIVFTDIFVDPDGSMWSWDSAIHLHHDEVKCGKPETWEQNKLRELGLETTPAARKSATSTDNKNE